MLIKCYVMPWARKKSAILTIKMRTRGKPVLPVETSRSAKKIMSLIN